MEKMWVVLVHLTDNMWRSNKLPWNFDDEQWDYILNSAAEKGFNTILLDLGDGIQYKSHPEISLPEAWSHDRMRAEIKKAAGLGLTIIPKLNFSTTHDCWLGEYERMVSTSVYYKVCKDLIEEVYELFDHPKYIHLGMDEEGYKMAFRLDYVCYRQHALIWHDMKVLFDYVAACGATPWIWADMLVNHPEEFRKHFAPGSVLLSPWQYFAMYEENFTPITHSQADYEYYTTGAFKGSGIVYVEEDPACANYRKEVIPAMLEGYGMVPTTSNCFKCYCNHSDTLRWFKEKTPDEQVIGFMTAPWLMTTNKDAPVFEADMQLLTAARKQYYSKKN